MLKLGIHRKDQLKPETLYSFFGRRRFVALDLYDEYEGPPEEVARFQEHAIRRLAVSNGAFKRTHADRFAGLDREVLDVARTCLPQDVPLKVHDVAVSDGRTAVSLFSLLSEHYGANLRFVASDCAVLFRSVRRPGETRRIVVDESGNLIQFVCAGFVFNAFRPESGVTYPVNFLARTILRKHFAEPLAASFRQTPERFETTDIRLLCPSCRALLEDPRFTFQTYDLLSGPSGTYHLIRAMNILTRRHFSEDDLARAVRNLFGSLAEGGLLVTGANAETGSAVDGAIYRKERSRLHEVRTFGARSPIAAITAGRLA